MATAKKTADKKASTATPAESVKKGAAQAAATPATKAAATTAVKVRAYFMMNSERL